MSKNNGNNNNNNNNNNNITNIVIICYYYCHCDLLAFRYLLGIENHMKRNPINTSTVGS